MKININKNPNIKPQEVEVLKSENTNKFKLDVSAYDTARVKLHDEFIEDMKESSIDLEVSEEQILIANKKYKDLRIKKNVLYFVVILFFLSMTIFGAYRTFFIRQYTGEEIASLANYYNGKTNFPTEGVYGFIETQIPKMLEEKLNISSKAKGLKVTNPVITAISTKSSRAANVYFYITIETTLGSQNVNCFVPICWNDENWIYQATGEVLFTSMRQPNESNQVEHNEFLSFDDITIAKGENTETSKVFIDNFLKLLYSNENITPYYTGTDILTELDGGKYSQMVSYTLYEAKNLNGYNAEAVIVLELENGITYHTTKYFAIDKTQTGWIITAVL